MKMKSLVNFCVFATIALVGISFLASGKTNSTDQPPQQMVSGQEFLQVQATRSALKAAGMLPEETNRSYNASSSDTKESQDNPPQSNVIGEILVSILAPADPSASNSATSPEQLPGLNQLSGKTLDQIYADADPAQKEMFNRYANGANPSNLFTGFCTDIKSDGFVAMSNSIKENSSDPRTDPGSPAMLMLFFDKLGSLFCK